MNLIFFGDSIMQGLWDEEGGWASRVKQDIYSDQLEKAEAWKDWNIVYMRANSSETSEGLKDRVGSELRAAGDSSDHSWTMVFSIGMNDCTINQEAENEVSKEDFRDNLAEIIDSAGKVVDRIIVVGLNPVDESLIGPENKEEYYLNTEVEEYDGILREVAEEKGLKFISVFQELESDTEWNKKLFDGLHPNTEGHKKLYEVVKRPVFEELGFDFSKES